MSTVNQSIRSQRFLFIVNRIKRLSICQLLISQLEAEKKNFFAERCLFFCKKFICKRG